LKIDLILKEMHQMAPDWMQGCVIRPAFYEPTFHKFKGELVSAIQVHVDGPFYNPRVFRPYRLVNLFFKGVQRLHPDFKIWRNPPYEYEEKHMPIDILSGHSQLREWVADARPLTKDWDESLKKDEQSWEKEREPYLLY
jgi:uncharacterized protein YbbC (DUF1343 family)